MAGLGRCFQNMVKSKSPNHKCRSHVIKAAAAAVIGNASSLSSMPPYLITILLPSRNKNIFFFFWNSFSSIYGATDKPLLNDMVNLVQYGFLSLPCDLKISHLGVLAWLQVAYTPLVSIGTLAYQYQSIPAEHWQNAPVRGWSIQYESPSVAAYNLIATAPASTCHHQTLKKLRGQTNYCLIQ